MSNSEKIQILKDNIKNHIINSKIIDEILIFNFAKQQSKEMKIEISKGEIKSIIYEILILTKEKTKNFENDNFFNNKNLTHPNILKELENENPFLFP